MNVKVNKVVKIHDQVEIFASYTLTEGGKTVIRTYNFKVPVAEVKDLTAAQREALLKVKLKENLPPSDTSGAFKALEKQYTIPD